jgi:hypothetical protein
MRELSSILLSAQSQDVNARNSAEQQLKQWETQSLVSDSATIKINK